ncbi:Crp/Fnr family transcriptional regulator [Eleftheria terrae]|uniref:Crp/Fnr family transcriptional regulator n=1 Tax=Eleftheria terrae TaxID=1597781 RepID=UPI00263B0C82|nr:Crp/Fnr family transcriptional regulator [Eleftheria terrae]WKB52261.1 Crp/Fnr family transcriptional regulator [Eleftheria terrae]
MSTVTVIPHAISPRPLRLPTAADAAGGRSIPLDARTALLQAALQPARVARLAAQAMAELAQEHPVAASCPLFTRRDTAHSLWFVASGQVALGTLAHGRPVQQTRRVEPGQWLDAASAWLQRHYLEDAWAQGDALLWSFDIERLRACCNEHPSLSEGLIAVLAQRVRELTEGTLGLMLKDAEARCATWLLQHAEQRPGPGGTATVLMRERKRAIASQLAVTPETFSRVLRQLREKRIIEVEGYLVRVLDLAGLREIADCGA